MPSVLDNPGPGIVAATVRRERSSQIDRLRITAVVIAAAFWGVTLPALLDSELAVKFGADFVQYYTLGWLAIHRSGEALYDAAALHAAQAALVPALAGLHYPAVYPPQAGPMFAPLALLSYGVASALWMIVSAFAYLFVIYAASRRLRDLKYDPVLLWMAAVTFPPFWYLVLFRQNSIILLVALFIGSRMLEQGRSALAGFALGFLALKPQFGLGFAILALYRRDVWLIVGAVVSVLVQAGVAVGVFGFGVIWAFAHAVPEIASSANLIEPFLYKSLSLRTPLRLLPSPVAEIVWVAASIGTLAAMVRVCRPQIPTRPALAVVILASVLVNPHMYIYDGVVLVLPFTWLGEWRLQRKEGRVFLFQAASFWAAAILMMPLTLASGSVAAVTVTICAILAVAILFATAVRDLKYQYREPIRPIGVVTVA